MESIAITGASGYLGRHLLAALTSDDVWRNGERRVKVLTREAHDKPNEPVWPDGVEVVRGDLLDAASLQGFIEPGSSVIHLAYLWHAGETGNLQATANLLDACERGQASRLIHCSTAIVVGEVDGGWVDETTPCRPGNDYERGKLKIEQVILERDQPYDSVILRPTSVFGPEALPLRKFAADVIGGNPLSNYLKSCFLSRRRMNLVHIDNVVAALLYAMRYRQPLDGRIFIVSDDEASANTYAGVERILRQSLGIRQPAVPAVPLPYWLLRGLLRAAGKTLIKPSCAYSQKRLETLGFSSPKSFEQGLREYAAWYASSHSIFPEASA